MQIREKRNYFLFGAMVWIFLSLNAVYFNFSFYAILRWILPVLLFFVAVNKKGQAYFPPMIVITFIFAVLPSLINSVAVVTSVLKAVSFLLVVYCLYTYFMQTKEEGNILNVMEIFMALVLIFQVLNIIFVILGLNNPGDGRAKGFTTNANTLGVYSNITIWASYYFLKKNNKAFPQFCFLLIMVLSIYTALESGSKMAFILAIVNLIVIFFIQVKSSLARGVVIICALMFVILLLSGSLYFLNITALNRLMEEGGTTRGDLWEEGLAVWRKFKYVGCGYKTSGRYNIAEKGMEFHNSYLTLLIEVGLIGTALIALGVIGEINNIIKMLFDKLRRFEFDLSMAAFFIFVSMMVNAWSESFLFSMGSTEAFCFWMIFVWLMVYTKNIEKENES